MPLARLVLIAVMIAALGLSIGTSPSAAGQGAAAIRAVRQATAPKPQQQPPPAARPPAPAPAPAPSPAPAAPVPTEQGRGTTAPPAAAGAPPPASTNAVDAQQLIEPPGFDYKPEGRRDPFVSLVGPGRAGRGGTSAAPSRPAGIAGLGVGEITLKGTMRGREGFVAMVQGADQKTYIVRPGDKLYDGTIRTISQNDLVVVQQVSDPLSLEKQREVRKVLRQTEANQQ